MRNKKLRILVEGAIMIAVGQALSQLPTAFPSPIGRINFSIGMIPIILFALRWGWKYGVFTGLLYGLSNFIVGDIWWLHFAQVMIEYTIPFACIGFAGIFSGPMQKSLLKRSNTNSGVNKESVTYILLAIFTAGITRYFWHFLAGVLYWGEYAPEGMGAVTYSFLHNGANMLVSVFACGVVFVLLSSVSVTGRQKLLFIPKNA